MLFSHSIDEVIAVDFGPTYAFGDDTCYPQQLPNPQTPSKREPVVRTTFETYFQTKNFIYLALTKCPEHGQALQVSSGNRVRV